MSFRTALLSAATATAAACAAAIVLLPIVAQAAPATVANGVNVRSGPSTNSRVVGHLFAGQHVDVGGCRNGWCYITDAHGFVSSRYLRNGNATIQPNFNLNFGFPQGSFSIGSGGVSIGIGNTPQPGPRPGGNNNDNGGNDHNGPGNDHNGPGNNGPHPGDNNGPRPGNNAGSANGDVCFYSGNGYTGDRLCLNRGQSLSYIGNNWNNRISSIRNSKGYEVTVCNDAGYDTCRTYTTSASILGSFNNVISSIRVR